MKIVALITLALNLLVFSHAFGQTDDDAKDKVPNSLGYIIGEEADSFNIVYTASGKIGLTDKQSKLIVDTVFYGFVPFNEYGFAWVKLDSFFKTGMGEEDVEGMDPSIIRGKWKMIDRNGHFTSDSVFDYAVQFNFEEEYALGKTAHGMVLLKKNGRLAVKGCWDMIDSYTANNLFHLHKKNTTAFFSAETKRLIKIPFKYSTPFFGKYAIVIQDGKKAIVNKQGKLVTTFYSNLRDCPWTLIDSFPGSQNDLSYYPLIYNSISSDSINDKNLRRLMFNHCMDVCANQYTDTARYEDSETSPYIWEGSYYYCYYIKPDDGENVKPVMEFSTLNPEFFACIDYYDETAGPVNYTSTTYSVLFQHATSHSCTRGSGGGSTTVHYLNYLVKDEGSIPITIDSILQINHENTLKINVLLNNAFTKLKDKPKGEKELNPDSFFHKIRDNFSIGKNAITFYVNFDSDEPLKYPLVINYEALKPYLKKEWVK